MKEDPRYELDSISMKRDKLRCEDHQSTADLCRFAAEQISIPAQNEAASRIGDWTKMNPENED